MESNYIVEMKGISKQFGSVQALNQVDLELREGEILGLVGDNAAGKSTLMKILSGAHVADSGQIIINGEEVSIHHPRDAPRMRHRNDLPGPGPLQQSRRRTQHLPRPRIYKRPAVSQHPRQKKRCIPNLPRCSRG